MMTDQKRKILVVDDSKLDRDLLVKVLDRRVDLEIVGVGDSEECLKLIESGEIGLILLDVVMPEVSGIDVLRSIREKYNQIELPVIMVTSRSETKDFVEALQLGANDYITKPINFDVAVSRIQTHLQLSDLSNSLAKVKELVVLDAMIATYNHEINNPLAIAIGCVDGKSWGTDQGRETIRKSLWRISDIIKKIAAVSEKKEINFEDYSNYSKILNLKDD